MPFMEGTVGTDVLVGPVGRMLPSTWSQLAFYSNQALNSISCRQYSLQTLYRWLLVCRGRRMPFWLYLGLLFGVPGAIYFVQFLLTVTNPVPDSGTVRNPRIGPTLGVELPPSHGFAWRSQVVFL
jgi:hypothetical protein